MKIRSFISLVLPLMTLVSCEKDEDPKHSEPSKLHVFMWADYVKPELVQRFEREQNCRVVIDTFDSNESMLAKLKAGASGFDIALPSSYMVRLLKEENMISEIDRSSN